MGAAAAVVECHAKDDGDDPEQKTGELQRANVGAFKTGLDVGADADEIGQTGDVGQDQPSCGQADANIGLEGAGGVRWPEGVEIKESCHGQTGEAQQQEEHLQDAKAGGQVES